MDRKSSFTKIDFPVVGIGASAGGLEALEEFFKNLPRNPGAAFIIVQHLAPNYKSLMDELLSRYTTLAIKRVEDGMQIEKNHIYLIPPKYNMTIFHGKLLLNEQVKNGKTLNLPIDIFFRSLAKDQEKNAIGIILSGTGSDGTLGIRAIKEYGGLTMVQDDKSAKFDGMPRSSISTGMIDLILPPSELAEELSNYFKHPFVQKKEQILDQINKDENQLSKVIAILRDVKGVDFSNYKENTIIRRLEKRISINRFERIEEYTVFLMNNPKEINTLYNELLIGVTRFFRDEDAFDSLKKVLIPKLFENRAKDKEIRLWVSGCSTGEEAYSLAILCKEYMAEKGEYRDVKIFATDIDDKALEFAGAGIYPDSIIGDVSSERITRFFTLREGHYQVHESIRGMIIFARHNLFQDPPFSKIDMVSCRNLLIYLSPSVQEKVLRLIYMALNPNGFMFLGSSESLGNLSEAFKVLDSKNKLYESVPGYELDKSEGFNLVRVRQSTGGLKSSLVNLNARKSKSYLIENVFNGIVGQFLPPSAIIDEHYNVLHTINNMSDYLRLPIGEMSVNLLKMFPANVSLLVGSLLRRAKDKQLNDVLMMDSIAFKEDANPVQISVRKINTEVSEELYFLISIEENKRESKPKQKVQKIKAADVKAHLEEKIKHLEKDLQHKSESLQATVEELETSNEELQSSNEELIASNEELQSTNEELQSVNEELYTVNSEHIRKIEELTELNADVNNLLKNTGIGTLFLDSELNIRKINEVGSRLTNIISTDIGRPIKHLSFERFYDGFLNDIKQVVETLQSIVKEFEFNKDEWYLMKIQPYRTAEYAVDGIVITFMDISSLKLTQETVGKLNERLGQAMEIGELAWWEWDVNKNRVLTSAGKYKMLGYKKDEVAEGFEWWVEQVHPADRDTTMQSMRKCLEKGEKYDVDYRIKNKHGVYLWYRDRGGVVKKDKKGNPEVVAGLVMNISKEIEDKETLIKERVKSVQMKADFNQVYDHIFKNLNYGIVFQNKNGEISHANPKAEELLGLSLDQMKGLKSVDPNWKAIKRNGDKFEGESHPAMLALKQNKEIHNVEMGVYNPKEDSYKWINIDAYPLTRDGEQEPYQVYTVFTELIN